MYNIMKLLLAADVLVKLIKRVAKKRRNHIYFMQWDNIQFRYIWLIHEDAVREASIIYLQWKQWNAMTHLQMYVWNAKGMIKRCSWSGERGGATGRVVRGLLDVTEQSHTPEYPVVRVLGGLELHGSDVGQVRPDRLLVDGALVHPGVPPCSAVDGVDVDDG